MDPIESVDPIDSINSDAVEMTSRLVALEMLVENAYAAALMQARDPVAEARQWSVLFSQLGRQLEAGVDDREIATALATGVARALDSIFARIRARVEHRAGDFHTAGTA